MNIRFLALLGCLAFLATGSQNVLTSGVTSAVMDVASLDEEPDPNFRPLSSLQRESDGTFVLEPGAFEMTFESYCLLPGTHGPVTGDGFLYAPHAGPGSEIIETVLDRSLQHPALPQEHIQELLWAILSRADISDLDGDVQHAATTLLTPAELDKVRSLSRQSLAERLRGELLARAPAPLQQMLDAQERLRALLSDASATYDELRAVAVLEGRPEPQAGDREIPAVRWSYHPDGYFIRLAADDYTRTRVQLIVPRDVRASLTRDAKGRITRAAYPGGLVVEADYDEAIPALAVPGDPGIKGYAFSRLRFSAGGETADILNEGWTFAGPSNGLGDASGLPSGGGGEMGDAHHVGSGPFAGSEPQEWKKRFDGAKERYGKWKDLQKDAADRRARDDRDRRGPSERDVADVTDEGHYRDGYDAAKSGDLEAKFEWFKEHKRRERNAFEYVHCMLTASCADEDDRTKRPPPPKRFKSTRGAGVPGWQGGQLTGPGPRPARR